MTSKRLDLSGLRFDRLTAIRDVGASERKQRLWLCVCDCGATTIVPANMLRSGNTKSCGCLRAEGMSKVSLRHGATRGKRPRSYGVWQGMRARCLDPLHPNYGGRGITVCDRWNDYSNFAEDMGEPLRGATLDRIDNDQGYSPENCRWATMKEQSRNRRSNRRVTYRGETRALIEWAEISGINFGTLKSRLNRGWAVEKSIETPVRAA